MTGAREDILGRIRSANGRRSVISANALSPSIIPARARGSAANLLARFELHAVEASASVARIALAADVPVEVARYLAQHSLGAHLVVAPDPAVAGLPWHAAPGLSIRPGRFERGDTIAVTGALAGIAETGTIMVASGAMMPNALHLLPETHIAVLPADCIVGPYEAAYARLATLPRAVTMITGPSRTSDIERTVLIGVHGPRRLHIVIVGRA